MISSLRLILTKSCPRANIDERLGIVLETTRIWLKQDILNHNIVLITYAVQLVKRIAIVSSVADYGAIQRTEA